MPELIDLAGTCVIVTGASSGIGESTARLLHAAGAHPVLAARRADRLAALSKELGGALAVPTDVTDQAQVRDLVAAALDRHQRIDGLVNNAGASLHGPLDQVDVAQFSRILQLNVAGLLAMTQAVLPAMRQQGFGRIVNVSSGTTRRTAVGVGAYASTKTAVNMLSAVLRQELAADGIAVSLLLPSITATEFGGGRFTIGASPRPGMVAHSPDYVAGVVLRLLRTGEESFDIPHGPEQPGLAQVHRLTGGAASRPALDDLRVHERSGELDAEPGVGAGPGGAELALGVGEGKPVGVDLDPGRADDEQLAVHHLNIDVQRAGGDHGLAEVERDLAQLSPELDAPGHHPASGPDVPAAVLLDHQQVFRCGTARPAARQVGGQRGQLGDGPG